MSHLENENVVLEEGSSRPIFQVPSRVRNLWFQDAEVLGELIIILLDVCLEYTYWIYLVYPCWQA